MTTYRTLLTFLLVKLGKGLHIFKFIFSLLNRVLNNFIMSYPLLVWKRETNFFQKAQVF